MTNRRKARSRWEARHPDKVLPAQRVVPGCRARNSWIYEDGKRIPVQVYLCSPVGRPSRERMAIHLAGHVVGAQTLGMSTHSMRIISDHSGEVILYGHASPETVRKVRELLA